MLASPWRRTLASTLPRHLQQSAGAPCPAGTLSNSTRRRTSSPSCWSCRTISKRDDAAARVTAEQVRTAVGGTKLGDVASGHVLDRRIGHVGAVDATCLEPVDRPVARHRPGEAPQEQHVAAGAVDDEQRRLVALGGDRHEGAVLGRRLAGAVAAAAVDAALAPPSAAGGERQLGVELGPSVAHEGGERGDRRGVEDRRELELDAELLVDPRHQADGDQRVTAELEEVVVVADLGHAEQLDPQATDPADDATDQPRRPQPSISRQRRPAPDGGADDAAQVVEIDARRDQPRPTARQHALEQLDALAAPMPCSTASASSGATW